jgi:acyl carrier protein
MYVENGDISTQVRTIIAMQLGLAQGTISEQDTLDGLGADSLDLVEIIIKLEERFGISIDDSRIEKLLTVGKLIDYISQVQKQK